MASTIYSGYQSSALDLAYTRAVSVSGGSNISNSRIDSVTGSFYMSTTAYSNTYTVTAKLLDSSDNVLDTVIRSNIKFDSTNYGGEPWTFNFSTSINVNNIAKISLIASSNGSKIFVKYSQSVTIGYTAYTACSAPSSISLSKTTADPSESITLSWSGATSGDANTINGYTIQRSVNGGAYADWQSVSSTSTSGSYTVIASSSYGGTYGYKIITKGTAGSSFYSSASASKTVTSRTPTACTAPSTVSLSKTLADPSESGITLSWSGAASGTINTISSYTIQRSTDSGAYADWVNVTSTSTSGSYSVTASSSYGGTYGYRIITKGEAGTSYYSSASASKTVTSRTPTACGAPTSAYLSGTVAESAPTLTWSGASSGTINAISSYEIQYAESTNNSIWGDWNALTTVSTSSTAGSTSVNLSSTRGYYRKYQIRTRGAAGSAYYSAWKVTTACRYNSIPTAPTTFSASPAVYVSGDITLTYSGATDVDNNISTYNVQYATSADGSAWGSWVSLANGATSHTPTLSAGYYIKYQARAVDAFSQTSDWKASNTCGKNTAPATPTINYPQASKTIYNSKPRILITLGADPESHAQTLTASGYTLSRSSSLSADAKIIARKTTDASAGTVSISIKSTDLYSEDSGTATRSLTYAQTSFTDASIAKGTTKIKASHINELRTCINDIRQYYGLAEISWAETIIAGETKSRNWKSHIIEMQDAIDDVVTLVNGWDITTTTNRIVLATWITPGNQPQASVMQQLRTAIPLL